MGYLINPTGLRMGWFSNWKNNYYIEFRYYPELLYIIFRLRLFILHLFSMKEWKRQAWLYSHYFIRKTYWGLSVRIYYYDGRLESEWREFAGKMSAHLRKWKLSLRKSASLKKKNIRPVEFVDFYTALVIASLYKNFFMNKIQLFRGSFLNNSVFKKLGKLFDLPTLSKNTTHLLLYYNMLFNIVQEHNREGARWNRKLKIERGSALKEISHILFYYAWIFMRVKPILLNLSLYLKYVFSFIHKGKIPEMAVNFFLITNEYVSANFLAIYVAERLRQKYTVKYLMNPLVRELNRVRKRFARKRGVDTVKDNKKIIENYSLSRKSIFYLFRSYKRFYFALFTINKSWFNYDLLIVHYITAKELFNNSIQRFLEQKKNLLSRRYFGICRTAFSKKAQLLFLVKPINSKLYREHLFSRGIRFYKNKAIMAPDQYIFVREMHLDFQENWVTVLKSKLGYSLLSRNMSYLPVWNSIKVGLTGLIKYSKYTKFSWKISRLSEQFDLNIAKYKRQKIKLQSRFQGLLGFKFQFKGRFTRKLIAASYTYSIGRMPLTTLNADIDYAFKTIAIKNSAVGVKVWIYKGKKFGGSPYFCQVT